MRANFLRIGGSRGLVMALISIILMINNFLALDGRLQYFRSYYNIKSISILSHYIGNIAMKKKKIITKNLNINLFVKISIS